MATNEIIASVRLQGPPSGDGAKVRARIQRMMSGIQADMSSGSGGSVATRYANWSVPASNTRASAVKATREMHKAFSDAADGAAKEIADAVTSGMKGVGTAAAHHLSDAQRKLLTGYNLFEHLFGYPTLNRAGLPGFRQAQNLMLAFNQFKGTAVGGAVLRGGAIAAGTYAAYKAANYVADVREGNRREALRQSQLPYVGGKPIAEEIQDEKSRTFGARKLPGFINRLGEGVVDSALRPFGEGSVVVQKAQDQADAADERNAKLREHLQRERQRMLTEEIPTRRAEREVASFGMTPAQKRLMEARSNLGDLQTEIENRPEGERNNSFDKRRRLIVLNQIAQAERELQGETESLEAAHNAKMARLASEGAAARLQAMHRGRDAERETLTGSQAGAENDLAAQAQLAESQGRQPEANRLREQLGSLRQNNAGTLSDFDKETMVRENQQAAELRSLQHASTRARMRFNGSNLAADIADMADKYDEMIESARQAAETSGRAADQARYKLLKNAKGEAIRLLRDDEARRSGIATDELKGQADAAALRNQGRGAEAQRVELESRWAARLAQIGNGPDRAGERDQSIRLRDEERKAFEIDQMDRTRSIRTAATGQELRNRHMTKLADAVELKEDIRQQLLKNVGDPDASAAIRRFGAARAQAMLQGNRQPMFGLTGPGTWQEVQSRIFQGGGGNPTRELKGLIGDLNNPDSRLGGKAIMDAAQKLDRVAEKMLKAKTVQIAPSP